MANATPAGASPSIFPSDLNVGYFKKPEGQLRSSKGVLSLVALICTSEGYCTNDTGRFGFTLLILVICMIEAILVIVMFVLRFDKKIAAQINIPLSLLINDGVSLLVFFIISTLSLLSIGRCEYMIAARVLASLFVLGIFLSLVGLLYLDYVSWEKSIKSTENGKETGTTITESSPTVLA